MKIGMRTPSLNKSVSARTTGYATRTVKSSYTPNYGRKGNGYITNPKKAVYNKAYHKTTRSYKSYCKGSRKSGGSDLSLSGAFCLSVFIIGILAVIIWWSIHHPLLTLIQLSLYIIGLVILNRKEQKAIAEERRIEEIIDNIENPKQEVKSMNYLDDIENNL